MSLCKACVYKTLHRTFIIQYYVDLRLFYGLKHVSQFKNILRVLCVKLWFNLKKTIIAIAVGDL